MKWMTIDPGISGTGWAIFDTDDLRDLVAWGTIHMSCKGWISKSQLITKSLKNLTHAHDITYVYCEWPSFQNVVAQNTGSIIKLAYLIGRLSERLEYVTLIPVVEWKGQLPKAVTQARAEKFFKVKGFKSHAADAVALGQYVIEKELELI